jgi:hypothetical protein
VTLTKRYWSGQITTAGIIETCRRYKAEVLVLPVEAVNEEWKDLLEREYDFGCSDKKSLLYVVKRL